jgi:hypothetical protein
MKTTLLTFLSSVALAVSAFGQTPTISPADATSSAVPAAPSVSAGASVSPSASPGNKDDLESRIEKKVKKGLHITFGDDDEVSEEKHRDRDHNRGHDSDVDDTALMAIPIVGIIFTTLFGAPVMIVGVIMFFSYWKARSLHRTVRMMVEKGQPVPEALFATPPRAVRQRSDMRRGVVLVMVGLGIMVFFAAVNDWEGGSWAMGIIPFLIGVGYLLVWKLEGPKDADKAPPLP